MIFDYSGTLLLIFSAIVPNISNMSIILAFETDACRERALQLSKELDLPLYSREQLYDTEFFQKHSLIVDYILWVTEARVELREGNLHSKTRIFVDFITGPLGYRRVKGGGVKQLIAKAVGLKSKTPRPIVFDATAGLGQDAFILASLGCTVILAERSAIIAKLLEDGMRRATQSSLVQNSALKNTQEVSEIIHRMQLFQGNALEILSKLPSHRLPDVIYLDPMFPPSQKSALTKIEMRIIRDIVGSDEDADALLTSAIHIARRRVVVKRPLHAPPLINTTLPDYIVKGQRNRYDVYLIKELN